MSFATDDRLSQHRFASAALGNARNVCIQKPPANASQNQGVLVFLDGEHYVRDIGAVEIVEALQHQAGIPALLPVYVSHIDYPTRWRESFCNPSFATFLADELVPWVTREFDVSGALPNAVVGVSLTGLSAAHAGLCRPETLHRVLCQSGSFWWNDGWLVDEVSRFPASQLAISLSIGTRETDENVAHGNGLFQKESQLSSNRRMRDAIANKGFRHNYREFEGGHDFDSFRRDLPDMLRHLQAP